MKIYAILLTVLLSGCATILDGDHQDFTVKTINNKSETTTTCLMINEEETREFTYSDDIVSIHKDGNPLYVSCKNDKQYGATKMEPSFQYLYMGLDVILSFPITSLVVDGYTNALYKYPTSATVLMETRRR